jgi:hypothetical protein
MGKKVMTPFKMSPKQAGMIESIRKENPKAAKKIEAGIKDGDKKNKEDVPGPALMDQKYAAKMGGYSPIKKVGDKKSDAPKGFKSDMGDYEPTITASTKTLGGTGGAPYTNSKGEIKKKGEKLAHGGKVLSTQGNTKKRDKTTRQKVRQVTYKS